MNKDLANEVLKIVDAYKYVGVLFTSNGPVKLKFHDTEWHGRQTTKNNLNSVLLTMQIEIRYYTNEFNTRINKTFLESIVNYGAEV